VHGVVISQVKQLRKDLQVSVNSILTEIMNERTKQDAKWGVQKHHPAWWYVILGEEFGEVGRGIFELKEDMGANYREELVQVAAVAVAMIESFDRGDHEYSQ
jgi:putative component of toxin-antitoxin plasmid stabilization module